MTHEIASTWYDDFFTELPNAFWRAAVPPDQLGHAGDPSVESLAGLFAAP